MFRHHRSSEVPLARRAERATRPGPASVVVAAGSIAGTALVLAIAHDRRTDTIGVLLFALAATAVTSMLIRRAVPGPTLAPLGVVIALVSAWLVPQRPDAVSALLLAATFGVGAGLAMSAGGTDRSSTWARCAALVGVVALAAAGARTALLVASVGLVVLGAVMRQDRRSSRPARTSRRRVTFAAATLVLSFGAFVAYLGASTPSAGWFGGGVRHGDRSSGMVAITFDDGPNVRASPAIAAILDRNHTKGTFFIIGKALDARPDVVRALYRDGQLVANHSYHHDQWRWLDPWYPELDRTQDAFRRHLGVCPAFFRPPHGQRTPFMRTVAQDRGVRLVMWDVSASDWTTTDARLVARRVLTSVRSGSIIDLHDGLDGHPEVDRSVVVRALPLILDGLRARGLRPVRLDRLIGGPAYRPCPRAAGGRRADLPAKAATTSPAVAATGTP
ncbi:MAG: polysaccharide deacetylase family protein [Actinomycetota bacterium]|nr:polysaccharide deacetylase family protein [Actinomycetota bacterium]